MSRTFVFLTITMFLLTPILVTTAYYIGKKKSCEEVSVAFLEYYDNGLFQALEAQNRLDVFHKELCK